MEESLPAPKAACVLSECGTEAHECHRLSASCLPLPTHSPPGIALRHRAPELPSLKTRDSWRARWHRHSGGVMWQQPPKQDKANPSKAPKYSDPAIPPLGTCWKGTHRRLRRKVQTTNAFQVEDGCITRGLPIPYCKEVCFF